MRLGLVCLGLLVSVNAAQGQRNRDKDADTAATKRACSVEECFFERDVRDFEVIDQTHVIVYTGPQRCAFHLELRGKMCDLSYAPELYFTRLMIEGTSAYGDHPLAVEITYHGGFINEREGVYNSEAPSEDDVRIGNRILAFYKPTDNMGGGVRGNALYASHGGLYRIAGGATGPVVLGRGEGYAIANNVRLSTLVQELARMRQR